MAENKIPPKNADDNKTIEEHGNNANAEDETKENSENNTNDVAALTQLITQLTGQVAALSEEVAKNKFDAAAFINSGGIVNAGKPQEVPTIEEGIGTDFDFKDFSEMNIEKRM